MDELRHVLTGQPFLGPAGQFPLHLFLFDDTVLEAGRVDEPERKVFPLVELHLLRDGVAVSDLCFLFAEQRVDERALAGAGRAEDQHVDLLVVDDRPLHEFEASGGLTVGDELTDLSGFGRDPVIVSLSHWRSYPCLCMILPYSNTRNSRPRMRTAVLV